MELYKELLIHLLREEEIKVTFPKLKLNLDKIVNNMAYRALQMIKRTLEDDSLDDPACFARIEEIVCIFESLHSGCGTRHDFG